MRIFLLCLVFWGCIACQSEHPQNKSFTIVTTTSFLADGIRLLVDSTIQVKSLMGPGIDPHLFKPGPKELAQLRSADLVIANGLHLEGRMEEVLRSFKREKPVLLIGDCISPQQLILYGEAKTPDPHIWMDPLLWADAFYCLPDTLARLTGLSDTLVWRNYLQFKDSLTSLHQWTQSQLETVPVQSRWLVTAHDAFGYFGRAYHWQVKGLQGISTAGDIGLQEVNSLINLLVSHQIPALFTESAVSARNLEAVRAGAESQGWKVVWGKSLYTDAPGNYNTPEGSYFGMFRYNVLAISQALNTKATNP